MWRKTLVYLGLVEEPEEHDEYDAARMDRLEPAPAAADRRPREREREAAPRREQSSNVRPLPVSDDRATHVRRLQPNASRVGVVRATSFDQAAEQVGERYRNTQPVLMDVTDVDAKTGRRLLDFVSGMIYALRGSIVPAGERAFLLVPDGVELPLEERNRLDDLGYRVGTAPRVEA